MSRADSGSGGGINPRTLAVAGAASALATLIVPKIWAPGTIAAAAAMPIIVALLTEALNRPAQHVSRAGELVRDRRTRRRDEDRFGLYAADRRRRRLRVALITGLLAFVIVGTVWTFGELAAGGSVSGDRRTTYFGGRSSEEAASEPSDDAGEEAAPAPAATATPEVSPTPPAAPTATATPAPGTAPPDLAPQATPSAAPPG